MKVYGYIRVSTDMQTVENQRFEINNYCVRHELTINEWIEDEGISGAKDYKKRGLGPLIEKCNPNDLIICSEISRLGRDLLMIMEILNILMKKEVRLYTIKDNFRLGDDMQCKVLAFAFGLSAEIERKLISQRTKEALARLKAEGKQLGRPAGRKSKQVKLTGHLDEIREMLARGQRKADICRHYKVNRQTLLRFLHQEGADELIGQPPRDFSKLLTKNSLQERANAGFTVAECARTFGVSAHTIANYAERYGITFGKHSTIYDALDEKLELIEARFVAGESSVSIRQSLGIPNVTWCTWLHRRGLCRSYNVDELRTRKTEVLLLRKVHSTPKQIGEALGYSTRVVEIVLDEWGL